MYVYIYLPIRHPLPKSINFIILLCLVFNRIFSGLRSQWITQCFCMYSNETNICMPNRLTSLILKPWKLLRLMNSYKFIDNSSKVIHTCSLNTNCSFTHMMFFLSCGSLSRSFSSNAISIKPYFCSRGLFHMIFKATNSLTLWSKHFRTTPKLPFPSLSMISYLYPIASHSASM